MKKTWLIGVLLFLLVSCKRNLYEKKELLEGFWVIETVVLPNQESVSYPTNPAVDYIEFISSDEGLRKKAYPQFDGTFQTSKNVTFFKIVQEKGKVLLHYQNDKNEWTEELVFIDENHFSVKNHQNLKYDYSRYKPFNINNL